MQRSSNRHSAILDTIDFGKIPPQSQSMEEAVLGAIMVDDNAILSVIDFLKPESFYREAHQRIFNSILLLTKKGFPTDLFSVTEDLRAKGELDAVGGPVYLTQLTSKIVSAANIEYHARIIAQKYIQRELIRISTELQNRAFDDTYDVAELMEYAESNLMELSGATHKKRPKILSGIISNVINVLHKIISGEIKLVGIPSGFISLDRATGGFKEQELTIIACRPSIGKTAIALQIAKNAALNKFPVGIFSLEMSEDELGRRYLSGETGRTNTELINGRCDINQVIKSSHIFDRLPIFIDDTPSISVIELKSKARRLVMENGIKMIIVDYLQLMKGEGQTREQEVSSISRGLKNIAKDLNIPIIALSQLNRRLENTADKKPNLSDLRESGSLEQDADIVIFPHRPSMIGQQTIYINNKEEDTKGLMLLILAKNRNGISHIEIKLKHNESVTIIYEEDEFKSNAPPNFDPNFDEELTEI